MNFLKLFCVFALTIITNLEQCLCQSPSQGSTKFVPMEEFVDPLQKVIKVFHKGKPGPLRQKRSLSSSGITYPGTKWCGPGDTARHYDDLGVHYKLDVCCREHDHCEPDLYVQNNGLCNTRLLGFRVSSCDCDERFKECLQSLNSISAQIVTELYRKFVKKCFEMDPYTGDCELRPKVF